LIILLQFARQSGRSAPRTIGAAERIARRIAGQALILLGVAVIALLLRAEGEQLGRLMPALTDVNAALRLGEVVGRSLFAGAGSSLPDLYPNARLPGLRTLAMIWLVTTIVLTCPNTMQIFGMARADGVTAWIRWRPTLLWGFLTVVLLTLALIGVTRPVEQYGFIYARF
jgi:hypothetical protein